MTVVMTVVFFFLSFSYAHVSEFRHSFFATNPPEPKLSSDVVLDYIQNDQIKVGVLKDAGGSLGYLSDIHNDVNMINIHDKGREVQLSYYADPDNYRPDVCGKVTKWDRDWPWNPIGSGDVYGNPSRINNYLNDKSAIVVNTTPLQWACNKLFCECDFETTYKLDGQGVHVTAVLYNRRSDAVNITTLRSQEEPAVYTIGQAGSLYSYTGDKPFQNDSLTHFAKVGGPPWVPGMFNATEKWAAFVMDNEDQFGVGIYNPTAEQFLAGFAGTPFHGGATDDDTGYIAPIAKRVLAANETYIFEYWLVLGNLVDIRNYIYERHKNFLDRDSN